MAHIIVVGNEKGGSGKSTTAFHLAIYLLYQGFRVASIETAKASVEANGGKVINGPMQVPGDDWVIQGIDPQGAMFSLVGGK